MQPTVLVFQEATRNGI